MIRTVVVGGTLLELDVVLVVCLLLAALLSISWIVPTSHGCDLFDPMLKGQACRKKKLTVVVVSGTLELKLHEDVVVWKTR